MDVQVLKAKCYYCYKVFACDPSDSGTSTYSKHINKYCEKYKSTDELQNVIGSFGPLVLARSETGLLLKGGVKKKVWKTLLSS